MIAVEVTFVIPDSPGDAHELVRERDCRLIRMGCPRTPQRPLLELGEWSVTRFQTPCTVERSACTVDEQHPQISIALLTDTTEAPPRAGGCLTRCEPEPACELAATLEGVDVADRGEQRRRGQQTEPGYAHERLDDRGSHAQSG
jgi:hypothetical protein